MKVALADEEEARNEETRLATHTANRRSSTLRSGSEALQGAITKLPLSVCTLFIRTRHPMEKVAMAEGEV